MKWFKPLAAAAFLLMLCLHPGEALSAASQSLAAWALSVVPSLLPFLIAAPALTSPEVCALLSRVSFPFLRFMRLPENSTGALLIGLLSGSPAGASAISSVSPSQTDPPGAYLRAALLASGASPAFLITDVAVTMLDSPAAGWLLLRSQLLAVFVSGLLLRSFGSGHPSGVLSSGKARGSVLSAMQTLLTVGGYMAFFSVLARLLTLLAHPSLETPLLAVLELEGGCRALSGLSGDINLILPLISAAACFGGISVYAQCMSFLAPLGVRYDEYAAGKLVQSALAALFTLLQMEAPWRSADPLLLSMLCLFSLALLLFIMLRRLRSDASARRA